MDGSRDQERLTDEVSIEDVPVGAWIYSTDGAPLGVVEVYLQMNGNRPARALRSLNRGRREFAYQRLNAYKDLEGTIVRVGKKAT